MTVTEYERNRLFSRLEELMGKEPATTMMNLLPPVGWGDVATRRDLDHQDDRINLRFDVIDRRFEQIDQRFEQVEHRLVHEFRAEMHSMRSDMQRTFATWMFASQAAMIAALGLILSIVN